MIFFLTTVTLLLRLLGLVIPRVSPVMPHSVILGTSGGTESQLTIVTRMFQE